MEFQSIYHIYCGYFARCVWHISHWCIIYSMPMLGMVEIESRVKLNNDKSKSSKFWYFMPFFFHIKHENLNHNDIFVFKTTRYPHVKIYFKTQVFSESACG